MPKRRFFRGSNGLLGAATARPYLIADCSTYDCTSRRRASKTRAFTARDARRHWLCLRDGVLGFQPRARLVAALGTARLERYSAALSSLDAGPVLVDREHGHHGDHARRSLC